MTTESAIEKRPEGAVTRAEHTRSRLHYRPNVDILENAEELTILADMPGIHADGVDIEFEKGTLTIHGKVNDRQPEEVGYLRQEYGIGNFYRTFQVSELIDAKRINAEYGEGVLTVHLPKTDVAKPRKITVKAK
ncbi:MAG: Hsp20/alpha crystallin family protein [Phycisphaerae bacterium]|nr:Hsp20/alpha crystallin family protein [Phycisphaerae bacterium]